jgi:hypothetical protein
LVSIPTQMPLWTREPQQQGFIYKYKVIYKKENPNFNWG